ncbi:hypothetical protein ACLOJK_005945 [Asimina triloba]
MMNASAAAAAASVSAFSNSSSLHRVFVYGSLLEDEVVRALLKRVPLSSPALLNGYHRFSIKGRVYPAIIPLENKNVAGRFQEVLFGLTETELHVLDTFEDVEYERQTVEISLMESTKKFHAQAYVWVNKDDPNLYGDWNFEEWRQLHMADFLSMTVGFMEELEQPESKTREAYRSTSGGLPCVQAFFIVIFHHHHYQSSSSQRVAFSIRWRLFCCQQPKRVLADGDLCDSGCITCVFCYQEAYLNTL